MIMSNLQVRTWKEALRYFRRIRTVGIVLFIFWLFLIYFSLRRDFKSCILISKQIYVFDALDAHQHACYKSNI